MILTIGHSTRPLDEFIELLQLNGATLLLDVRTSMPVLTLSLTMIIIIRWSISGKA